MELIQERARALLDYDSGTGIFTWRMRRGNVAAGSVAGSPHGGGYVIIGVDGRLHLAHRLAWLWMTGAWPVDQIDHVNGLKTDNRFANLREATTSENHQNMPLRVDNKSGATGVRFCRRSRRWVAQICIQYRKTTIGSFLTRDEAIQARRAAKAATHRFQPVDREALA